MLNALRKGVGSWVAKIFLGVLILSFGVWGIGDIFRGGKQAVLATIGGTKITNSELNAAYRREVQIWSPVSLPAAMSRLPWPSPSIGSVRNPAWASTLSSPTISSGP